MKLWYCVSHRDYRKGEIFLLGAIAVTRQAMLSCTQHLLKSLPATLVLQYDASEALYWFWHWASSAGGCVYTPTAAFSLTFKYTHARVQTEQLLLTGTHTNAKCSQIRIRADEYSCEKYLQETQAVMLVVAQPHTDTHYGYVQNGILLVFCAYTMLSF